MKVRPLKVEHGYMFKYYTCRYCKQSFAEEDAKKHLRKCFNVHRKAVSKSYSERARRVYEAGKSLPHNKRPPKEENNE